MEDEDEIDTSGLRRVLWENIQALMQMHYGGENLSRVATAAGFKGGANMTRVKAMETDQTVKTIARLARAFNLPVWQLMAPNLGANLYVIDDARRVVPLFDAKAISNPAESGEREARTTISSNPNKAGSGMRPQSSPWKTRTDMKNDAKKQGGK